MLLPDDAAYLVAMEVLRDGGLRAPQDISIAGYDGVRSIQALHPQLTTVRQDSAAMGREAARRLIDHLNHPNDPFDSVLIPCQLIEGETMGEARE